METIDNTRHLQFHFAKVTTKHGHRFGTRVSTIRIRRYGKFSNSRTGTAKIRLHNIIYKEIDLGTCGRIRAWILPLNPNLNPTTFKYKIYSVKVDLHCLKELKTKNQVLWILFAHPSSRRKMAENSILFRLWLQT